MVRYEYFSAKIYNHFLYIKETSVLYYIGCYVRIPPTLFFINVYFKKLLKLLLGSQHIQQQNKI